MNQEALQRLEIDRPAAAGALQRLEDFGLLHHAPGQRRVERRQGQRLILKDLHQHAARAKEQHRPKFSVLGAADDQLIAVQRNHRLHGDALKRGVAQLGAHVALDRLKGGAHFVVRA